MFAKDKRLNFLCEYEWNMYEALRSKYLYVIDFYYHVEIFSKLFIPDVKAVIYSR